MSTATDPAGIATRTAARAVELTKVYGHGDAAVRALDAVSVEFERGHFTAIMGPSGSGKSTLLHCLAGLDRVTAGRVYVGDVDLTGLREKELTRLRRDRLGFVFQSYNLLPTLTALENITLPMAIAGRRPDRAWLDRLVDVVGLRDRVDHRPSELSGGQQQRVAAARAMLSRPHLIFADEREASWSPDGNFLVYSCLTDAGDFDIWVHDFILGVDYPLLNGSTGTSYLAQRIETRPAWSPNGQILVFSWRRPDGNYDLYAMDMATHELVQLTRDAGRNERPSWAPDGRHLVFESTRSGSRQIWSMLADGTNVRQMTTQGDNESPNWSPK